MHRKWGLDVLRIVSMAAVVVIHTIPQMWDNVSVDTVDWHVLNIYNSLVRWAVPVFVMISGTLFLDPKREQTIKKLYSKNILRIVTIIIFWSFVYTLLYHPLEEVSLRGMWIFFKYWLLGHSHMWFLYMLVGLYAITPLLRCITRDVSAMRYFLVLAFIFNTLIAFITSSGHFSIFSTLSSQIALRMVSGFSFYYVLGYWISTLKPSRKFSICAVMLTVGGVILGALLTTWLSISTGSVEDAFFKNFSLPILMTSVGIFYIGNQIKIKKARTEKIVSILSNASLGVYMVHVLVLDILSYYGFNALMCPPIISVPIVALTTIVISFVVTVILEKIPVFNKYCI